MENIEITISHWFPIVTFCPVNRMPDLIFISVTFRDFKELYAVRKLLRRFWFKTLFMEEVAYGVLKVIPDASRVRVHLMFNRHCVEVSSNVV